MTWFIAVCWVTFVVAVVGGVLYERRRRRKQLVEITKLEDMYYDLKR